MRSSAGHIRTPRGDIKQHWNSLYPNSTDSLINMISCYMSSYVRDVDGIWWPVRAIRTSVEPRVRSLVGPQLNYYSIGDLLSSAMHDADNRGLDVVSARGPPGSSGGPFRWHAVGDEFLYPSNPNPSANVTQQMVQSAVRISYEEVRQARNRSNAGGVPSLADMTNPANFRALDLIPHEDTSSSANPTYIWQVSNIRSLPPNMQALLADQFRPGTQIRNALDGFAADRCTGGYHIGQAWECFKRLLVANPFDMIARACDGQICPANNDNPCPALSAGQPC